MKDERLQAVLLLPGNLSVLEWKNGTETVGSS